MVGIVDWDPNDVAKVERKFEAWRTTPSDLQVKLAQEDLWVVQSLLRVIKNTNGNVTEHSKAAIKHIDALDIGVNAVAAWAAAEGQVFHGGGEAGSGGGAAVAAAGATPAGAAAAGASGGGSAEDAALKQNRYVDEKGEPLAADAASPTKEFKRMPIRMKLSIDQRKIAKLLVECANSAMPIEVRRVRIKPGEGEIVDFGTGAAGGTGGTGAGAAFAGGTGMPGMAGPMRGGPGYGPPGFGPPGYGPPGYGPPGYGPPGYGAGGYAGRGGYGGMPGGIRPSAPGGMAGSSGGWENGPMDIPIEIQGIICIYNPPDINKLGKGAAGETPAESATPTAAAPSTAPATPAAPPAEQNTATPAAPAATPAAAPVETPAATPPATPADKPPADAPAAPATAPPATPPVEPGKAG